MTTRDDSGVSRSSNARPLTIGIPIAAKYSRPTSSWYACGCGFPAAGSKPTIEYVPVVELPSKRPLHVRQAALTAAVRGELASGDVQTDHLASVVVYRLLDSHNHAVNTRLVDNPGSTCSRREKLFISKPPHTSNNSANAISAVTR